MPLPSDKPREPDKKFVACADASYVQAIVRANCVLPPGPATFMPSMLRYLVDPYGVFRALARKYGDPFLLPIPGTPGSVVTCSAEGVRAVIGADREQFTPLISEATYQLFGRASIFVQHGDDHHQARKLMTPPFHSRRLGDYGALMESIVERHMATWQPGDVVPMHAVAHQMTLDIILRVLFGIEPHDARSRRFHAALDAGLDELGPLILHTKFLRRKFFGFGPWSRALRLVEDMRAALMAEIELHRADHDPDAPERDVLDGFLRARYEDGRAMTDLEIRDRLSDLIIGGHETTAVAIAWACYELCRDRASLDRLHAELDAGWTGPAPAQLAAVPYLEAVCLETLRLHPSVVFLSRRLARPLAMQGYEIPAGMAVSMALPVVHTDERVFPDPLRFAPDRFLGRTYAPAEFLPFGGGHKRCMGPAFGLYELEVTVATLLRAFDVAAKRDRASASRPRTITVVPRDGVDLVLRARRGGRRPSRPITPAPETASAPSALRAAR
jgi:cytochrome P450 family 110